MNLIALIILATVNKENIMDSLCVLYASDKQDASTFGMLRNDLIFIAKDNDCSLYRSRHNSNIFYLYVDNITLSGAMVDLVRKSN